VTEHLTAAQFREITKAEKHGRIPRSSKAKRTVGGIVFDSMAEAKRYVLLCDMQRAGQISHLTLQPKYQLLVDGSLIGHYIADFEYLNKTGQLIVEDVKSIFTRKDPLYRRNRKHMMAQYGIEVMEVVR
jgi:hypothetical protein